MDPQLRPCDNAETLQKYIDTYWRRGHILAGDPEMFQFTYCTPWVDRRRFPAGISVLGLYDATRMVGFLGAIVTPYPRPQSYWLALWHVLPDLKGGGLGGKLLQRMQAIAEESDGWIGTFGAGPEALPVYLKRGFCVRAARRWLYDPQAPSGPATEPALHSTELPPGEDWFGYRYRRHPVYTYEMRPGAVFRTEDNPWGRVTHVCWQTAEAHAEVARVFAREAAHAGGRQYVMDAWSFDRPGPHWVLAPDNLPSVFHPPEARGNVIYSVGRPFLVTRVHKGDCDQDRPNDVGAEVTAAAAVAHGA